MLSLKRLKGGKVAYIFDGAYAEEAIKLFPVITSRIIGIDPPAESRNRRTLSDIVNAVEGGIQSRRIEDKTLRLTIPKTTAGIPNSTDEIRSEINTLISELCAKDGLKYGQAWNKAYRILYDKTGFDVRKVEIVQANGKPSLIKTVLKYERGKDLIRLLRTYLDK